MDSKSELRKIMRARRQGIADRQKKSEEILQNLRLYLNPWPKAVGTYEAVGSEVQLGGLRAHSGSRLCLPRVEGEDLVFYEPKGPLVPGAFSIPEPDPKSSPRVVAGEMGVVLVPGVAFDRRGHRLGSGKGFYDRFLKNYMGLKVGVAFADQIMTDPLPEGPQDVAVDLIVTERFALQPQIQEGRKKWNY